MYTTMMLDFVKGEEEFETFGWGMKKEGGLLRRTKHGGRYEHRSNEGFTGQDQKSWPRQEIESSKF